MLPCLGNLNDFFAVIAFAVIVGQQAVAFGPQSFVFQGLSVDSSNAFFVKVLITLAGMPATREFGGTMVPLVTTAPAATIEP